MKSIGMPRHLIIEQHTLPHAEMTVDALIALWDQLAVQIILIVGEGGFDSLYARSTFLIRANFPWLTADASTTHKARRFTNLRTSLQSQKPELAVEANRILLLTLTDILASLIGESLTTSMLESAWGSDAPVQSGKEKNNGS